MNLLIKPRFQLGKLCILKHICVNNCVRVCNELKTQCDDFWQNNL